MGRINWTDCFQQNQWFTDRFRSGHHQSEGGWPGEGAWAQEREGAETQCGRLSTTWCVACASALPRTQSPGQTRGAEPSGLAMADTQAIGARATKDV